MILGTWYIHALGDFFKCSFNTRVISVIFKLFVGTLYTALLSQNRIAKVFLIGEHLKKNKNVLKRANKPFN